MRRIGAGGMGEVFEARSPAGRALAVKVVRPALAADPEFRTRFRREVTAARAVSGAFTAAVVDADTEGERPWLATLFVPGPSLHDEVQRHGPLAERRVRFLGAGLVEALQAIHAAGVVHRDLKPPNVLLAEDGPRVIDFGISVIANSTKLTQAGIAMGTPAFMAPEQLDDRPIGPFADVFALAGVLVFAASGTAPFGAGSPAALMHRILEEPPRLDGVPAGLRPLLASCLEKEPADRPELGGLIGDLIGDLLDGVGEAEERENGNGGDVGAGAGATPSPAPPTATPESRMADEARALLRAGLSAGLLAAAEEATRAPH